MAQVVEQDGGNECGLLAYALKIDPYNLKYGQDFFYVKILIFLILKL